MIFVTVGTQLPFDRLIRAVDVWAGRRNKECVFAQIGESSLRPKHIQYARFLTHSEHQAHFSEADSIIAHAGTGSILSALLLGKPIIVMPRRADLGEHRNDHQIATVKHFLERGLVRAAMDEHELVEALDRIEPVCPPSNRISAQASPQLIGAIRAFIQAP